MLRIVESAGDGTSNDLAVSSARSMLFCLGSRLHVYILLIARRYDGIPIPEGLGLSVRTCEQVTMYHHADRMDAIKHVVQ
jgi:hypothetical protein